METNEPSSVDPADALLREAFGERRAAAARLAERVTAALAAEGNPATKQEADTAPQPAARGHVLRHRLHSVLTMWTPILLAAAAGFLLAVLVFRPWEHGRLDVTAQPTATDSKPIAYLAVATGPVKVAAPNLPTFLCPTRGPIAAGAKVSTADSALCEVATDEGAAVRMDKQTAVTFDHPRAITVEHGEIWSSVSPASQPFSVKAADAKVVAHQGAFDLSCRSGAVVLKVVEGAADVDSPRGKQTVSAGQELRIDGGANLQVQPLGDVLQTTQWLNAVLAKKGPDDPELADRLRRMLAEIGTAKVQHLYETEIRALGPATVPALLSALKRTDGALSTAQRDEAARIVADLATAESIGELIPLLTDTSGQVRYYAAMALQRLTGDAHGRAPSVWQSDSVGGCETAQKNWQSWWSENRERYERVKAGGDDH